jgi:aldose 1-epimerase
MSSADGYDAVTIRSPGGLTEAQFVPDANMLCCSLRHRGAELLDTGQGVRAYAERGKTMGIPLLYPWANRLAAPGYRTAGKEVVLGDSEGRYALDPNGLPIHGALPGLLRWELGDGPRPERLRARLDWSSPELLGLFPFVHELEYRVQVGDGALEIVTTVRASGDDTVPVSFGFHPYLTIPGTRRQDWRVQLGAGGRLVLDEQMIPTGSSEPLDERRFALAELSLDEGLAGLDDRPEFRVSAAERALTVSFEHGYSQGQVYAPAGHDFICFEPMTAPANALRSGDGLELLSPGSEHSAKFTIAVTEG